ncbi:MAG: DUF4468 domain-containing protein [Flavobacteriaceae bacterium]|nr:DUF4468 domain-containing protein [Flavobacteriaceae bacterium]
MKKLLLFPLIALFCFVAQAQLIMIDSETGDYRYEDVVSVEGISQDQIKERAQKWMQLYYQPIDSIKIDSSSVSQKNTIRFNWKFIKKSIPIELFFDVTVKCKDNRYKYDFSNFEIGKITNGHIDGYDLKIYIERFPTRYQIFIEEPVDTEMTKAIESLEYFVTHGKLNADEENW